MPDHYFTQKPTSELKINKVKSILRNKEMNYFTASGLFSIKKVDNGSALLINNCIIKEKNKILDLGCGYGIIGLSLLLTIKNIEVVFSDINERALKITKENLKLNNVTGNLIQSNSFEKIKESFDVILLNPPQTTGKENCFQMIKDSKEHLNKKGTLQIVARHNKGGKELSKKMFEVFGNMKEIAKGSGYRTYLSQKP